VHRNPLQFTATYFFNPSAVRVPLFDLQNTQRLDNDV
jgi:hypothetical protein